MTRENSDNDRKLCIIIPCYNENKNIRLLISQVKEYYPYAGLVIINDASTDDTIKIVNSIKGVALLSLPINLGIGGAIQTGIKYANSKEFEYLVRIDGDGQHPVEEIEKLLLPLYSGDADFVIGSRFVNNLDVKGFKSTFIRRFGITFFTFMNKIILKQKITDSTSGFRAYNRKLIEYQAKNYPSFDYPEPEEIIQLGLDGYKILEVPISMKEREHGKSSINLLRSIYYMIKVTFSMIIEASRSRNEG